MKALIKLFLLILIIALAVGATIWLYNNKPVTKKVKPKRPIPLVSTFTLAPSTEKIFIEAFGNVVPAKKLDLSSEVEGRILSQNSELVRGGILKKGDFIAQIDRLDYQLVIEQRKAEIAEAEYQLEVEQGKQVVAKRELSLFEKEGGPLQFSKGLALREPHLKNANAKLEAAKSRLAAAELDNERTTIISPFNALVLDEFVEQSQLVGKQTPIATLVETDYFWVQVSVPLSNLSRLSFPDGKSINGSSVQVILGIDDGSSIIREGVLFKLLGDLDPKGRMARLLVTIKDPLNLSQQGEMQDKGRILLGSYVKVEIEAGTLENVFVIPRQAMREDNSIWLLKPDKTLDIRKTKIKWRRKEDLLIAVKIATDEKLITSRLQSPLPGMVLKEYENN